METYGMENLTLEDLVVEVAVVPIPKARETVLAANMGLKKRYLARKIGWASNGAYFLMDENKKKVAVFKPENEEDQEELSWGQGERAIREVAAFLLDHPKDGEEDGFGGVPPTTMVRCIKFKDQGENMWTKGSLQKFIPNRPWHDHDHSIFGIESFQKMTLIDLRYGNLGRHKYNVLMSEEGTLIPIDHGECFPKRFTSHRYDWTAWKQATTSYLPEMVAYVKTLDLEKDLEILRANGIQLGDDALFVFKVQHLPLKEGVLGGHAPCDIGRLITINSTSETLSTIVDRCMSRPTGDINQVMESIRVFINGTLKKNRETRLEGERISAEKEKTNVVRPQKIESSGSQDSQSSRPMSRWLQKRRQSENPSAVPKETTL